MSVPNFLDKLAGKKQDLPKTFLALVLSDHRVQAAVWQVVINNTEIVSLGTPVEWDGDVATTSELVQAVDATISSATEGLEIEPDEVVLGLANNWVDPEGIKPSKKDLIKSIKNELSLKPIGYVVISDCIVKYLKMQEGAPPTSILIQIDRSSCTVSLIELGKIKHTVAVGVSDHISSDVAEAIARLPEDGPLPSRFIVVSAMENTSDLVQELTAYDWQKKFSFLHTPKIEALPKDVEVHATAVAGGSEVVSNLGFNLEPEPKEAPVEQVELTPADFGFGPAAPPELDSTQPDIQPEPDPTPATPLAPTKLNSLKMPKLHLPQLPHFTFPQLPSFGSRGLYLIIGLVIVVAISLGFAVYNIPHAVVTIHQQAKSTTQSLNITLSPSASSLSVSDHIIPASLTTQTVTGSDTVEATGTKTIGDPSRGEVTVYNRTSLPKTLLAGTTLTASNLKFTLDSDVTVASRSAGADYVDVPGKATVKITASAFGSAGNLPAGTEFSIASFSKDSFVAKNDASLTGGTSQSVTVFADKDKLALLDSLKSKLIEQLKNTLEVDQTPESKYFLMQDTAKVSSQDFSSKLGEQATTVTGNITLTVDVLTYNQSDVQQLVEGAIDSSIPSGFLKTDIPPEIELTDTSVTDGGDVSAQANVTIYAASSLDTTHLQDLIKGKSIAETNSIIRSLPGVTSVDVKVTPAPPPRLTLLPLNPSHINFVTVATK